jgi:hypothetical protein
MLDTLLTSPIDVSTKHSTVNKPEMRLTSLQNLFFIKPWIRQLEFTVNTPRAYGTTAYNAYMNLWRNEHSVYFVLTKILASSPFKKS